MEEWSTGISMGQLNLDSDCLRNMYLCSDTVFLGSVLPISSEFQVKISAVQSFQEPE